MIPVKGPAPQSFLRCVFAWDHAWAAEVSDEQVGEANPRISLNRATARTIGEAQQILQALHGELLTGIADVEERSRRFAEAAERYHSLAAPSAAATEGLSASDLRAFARTASVDQLAAEMAARVEALWRALTPFLR